MKRVHEKHIDGRVKKLYGRIFKRKKLNKIKEMK